jgi:GT2 family glycosyltransferase
MGILNLERAPSPPAAGPGRAPATGPARVRVDGRLFSRGGQRFRVQGVTYGPFAPGADGQPFPAPERAADDFARMRAAGVNAVRTYHVPPEWLLHLADEQGVALFVDVPWPKHLCFLDSAKARRAARQAVAGAARRCREHPCLFAYSVGNEVPADVVRWHGARRVERFLAGLCDVARQADPDGLVTYASFPPTEYLDLPPLDFVTFNVYLHDREAFRRYLFRLQHLAGDRPLLLGELGMDTLRHGETEQAAFLAGHVAEARLMGLAGAFVFSWTDEWHTGGHPITDWAFGVTHADRFPKASLYALREVYERPVAGLLPRTPRVSVVVCTYNGGRTLEQCLRSLEALDYPDYEVIVVDDGSTDDTGAILERFPGVRAVRQPNRGLSAARNEGLWAATGEVVAYTDSDCFADPDWLTHLVYQLKRSGAAAVGGPNLTPEDGWLAGCVAAAPGQPTHVLEADQVAEHVPGCNMAFRRGALLAINGFDPVYRKAGDDVDVCWRLQQAGMWITFAPGAFVWHHRRQSPRAYLRQQGGYGEAEALLRFKHPEKFNGRGDGKWRGVLYGASLTGLRLGGSIIYRGVFATGLFQCVYRPAPAHWAMLPSTLEWHLATALAGVTALAWWPAGLLATAMLLLSAAVAALQAAQARLAPAHAGPAARLLVAALCYAQPLVRSWRRYRTRLFGPRARAGAPAGGAPAQALPPAGAAYWSEDGRSRTELLAGVARALAERGWVRVLDTGWSRWDVEVDCPPWAVVEACTAQEEHGGGRRLVRVRYRMRRREALRLFACAGAGAVAAAAALDPRLGAAAVAALLVAAAGLWRRGVRTAGQVAAVFDECAAALGMGPCAPTPGGGESEAGGR